MSIFKLIDLPIVDTFLNQHTVLTAKAYRSDLKSFALFLGGKVDSLSELKPMHVHMFRNALNFTHAKLSVNRKLAAVKSYLHFLCVNELLERNAAESVEGYSQNSYIPTEGLSDAEVGSILSSIPLNTETGRMHSAVLHTLFYMGLRRAEVCSLTVDSLGGRVGIPTMSIVGKGDRTRLLPIPDPVFTALKLYLEHPTSRARSIREAKTPLFHSSLKNSNGGKPLHHNSITKMFQTYCKKAGITKKVSPHSARVTCVSNALENGASVIQVQALGGWNSLEMVSRYDRRRQELKNSAVYAVNYGVKK